METDPARKECKIMVALELISALIIRPTQFYLVFIVTKDSLSNKFTSYIEI